MMNQVSISKETLVSRKEIMKGRVLHVTVDTVSIKRDIEQSKADKTAPSAPEQEKPDKAADDRHEPPCNEVDAHVGDGGGREARQKAHPRAVGQPCRQLHRHGRNDERQHLHDG